MDSGRGDGSTIPYELTCAVSKRVPRLYLENGQVTERSLRLLV